MEDTLPSIRCFCGYPIGLRVTEYNYWIRKGKTPEKAYELSRMPVSDCCRAKIMSEISIPYRAIPPAVPTPQIRPDIEEIALPTGMAATIAALPTATSKTVRQYETPNVNREKSAAVQRKQAAVNNLVTSNGYSLEDAQKAVVLSTMTAKKFKDMRIGNMMYNYLLTKSVPSAPIEFYQAEFIYADAAIYFTKVFEERIFKIDNKRLRRDFRDALVSAIRQGYAFYRETKNEDRLYEVMANPTFAPQSRKVIKSMYQLNPKYAKDRLTTVYKDQGLLDAEIPDKVRKALSNGNKITDELISDMFVYTMFKVLDLGDPDETMLQTALEVEEKRMVEDYNELIEMLRLGILRGSIMDGTIEDRYYAFTQAERTSLIQQAQLEQGVSQLAVA